jgi:putative FmdB family regulatory protein
MPTYAYRCEACGATPEYFQSMSERKKRKCPECGQSKLVRQIGGGAGFLFKGSGFYQTDYRSEAYTSAAQAEAAAAGSGSEPAGAKEGAAAAASAAGNGEGGAAKSPTPAPSAPAAAQPAPSTPAPRSPKSPKSTGRRGE